MEKFSYYTRQGIKNMMSHKAMSFASIGVMVLTLLVLGVFLCLWINVNMYMEMIGDSKEINVYLSSDAGGNKIDDIEWELKSVGGVSDVRFYSKEDRLKKVSDDVYGKGEELFEGGTNPLRNSFLITVSDLSSSVDVAIKVSEIQGVEEVVTNQSLIGGIDRFVKSINRLGVSVIFLFVLLAAFIMFNTIRMEISAQSEEIYIMKIIGATDVFVGMPYIIRGAIMGVTAALIGSVLIFLCYIAAVYRISISSLSGLIPTVGALKVIGCVLPVFMIVGIFVGIVGSLAAVFKILNKNFNGKRIEMI